MKILIAEDSEVMRIVLKSTLIGFGHDVIEAMDGEEAWQIVKSTDVSMVISDWMMPRLEGVKLCQRIRENNLGRYVYFILLTSLDDIGALVEGMEKAGADDFITKPFKAQELKARIHAGARIIGLEKSLEQKNKELRYYNQKLEKHLKAAAELQRSIIPLGKRIIQTVTFESMFVPSAFVSGDIFNYFPIAENKIVFYVLDVSGHGVSAAMLSFTLHRLLSAEAILNMSLTQKNNEQRLLLPSEVLSELNKNFVEEDNVTQYFTIIYGIIDTQKQEIIFCSAGHPALIHIDTSNVVCEREMRSIPVGMFANAEYEDQTISYQRGDVFYLYSDGFKDCMVYKKALDKEGLLNSLAQRKNLPLNDAINQIKDTEDNVNYSDDVTIIKITL